MTLWRRNWSIITKDWKGLEEERREGVVQVEDVSEQSTEMVMGVGNSGGKTSR